MLLITVGTILLIVLIVLTSLQITYSVTSVPIKNKITGAKAKVQAAEAKAAATEQQMLQMQINVGKLTEQLNKLTALNDVK